MLDTEMLRESHRAASDVNVIECRSLGDDVTGMRSTIEIGRGVCLEGPNFLGEVVVDRAIDLSGEFTSILDKTSILFSKLALASIRPSACLILIFRLSISHSISARRASFMSIVSCHSSI